jgi:mannose-6-phosphate isomerase
MDVYPLIFEPIFKTRIWGGSKLASVLGKRVPPGQRVGESWELSDLDSDPSVVALGPERGKTIRHVITFWGSELLGRGALRDGRFPLMIKFLDTADVLSVQVHADNVAAAGLGGGTRPKYESWYIAEAEPHAFIYRGLEDGVDGAELRRSLSEERLPSVLRRIPVRKGQAYFVPAGMVHAIGPGILAVEVSSPSDTTFRLFDWKRFDPDTGGPRPLHLDEALSCVRFEPVPADAERPSHLGSVWASVTGLIRSEHFTVERVRMVEGVEMAIPYEEMVIWIVLEGRGTIFCASSGSPVEFQKGDTVLLPAGLKEGRVQTREASMWLEVSVPIPSPLKELERLERVPSRPTFTDSGSIVLIGLPRKPV